MRRLFALLLLLTAAPVAAQPAVPRPAQFRFGIRVLPGVRPDDPYEGHVYQDADDHKIYIYNGTEWVALGTVADTGTSGQVLTSQGTGTPVWADVSGSGVPGGSAGQVQYKNGANFGGTALTYNGSAFSSAFNSVATSTWFKNSPTDTSGGAFEQVIGVGDNGADARPDHTMIIGWNVSGTLTGNHANGTGIGSSGLSFESYCSFGTGCLAGDGGQSETYFAMDDGKGHAVRPLGFFQRKFQNDDDSYLYVIARSDSWAFWDAAFENQLFAITPAAITANLMISSAAADDSDALEQNGVGLIRKQGNTGCCGVLVAPESGVLLGNSGEYKVRVNGNHFQMTAADIEDTTGAVRMTLGGGSAGQHPAFQNAAGSIIMKPLGTTTNVDMEIQQKGSGALILNAGSGALKIDGTSGVTASGTSCTITAITKGIITGATCTP